MAAHSSAPSAAHSCMKDGMCEHQRGVLRDNRLYMQENIYPDEMLMAHLLARGLLTNNVNEEISVSVIIQELMVM